MATINYDHPQRGMIHAFTSLFGSENVLHYDYLARVRETFSRDQVNQELIEEAVRFKPQWAWLQLQNTEVVTADTIQSLKRVLPNCVVSHWSGDVRSTVGAYFASICASTHLTLAANVGQLGLYMEAGAKEATYLAHGLDWQEDVLGLPEWEPPFRVPDAIFVGNNYGDSLPGARERQAAIRALVVAGIDAGIVGDGWGETGLPVAGHCLVKQQHHVWRRAKVAICVNHFPNLEGYHGDRVIVAMASGVPVVCRRFPLLDQEFKEGTHLLAYEEEAELLSHVRSLLADGGARKRIGNAGRAQVLLNHTWISRILSLLPRIEEIRESLEETHAV